MTLLLLVASAPLQPHETMDREPPGDLL